jgi:hypothetical protein
VAAAVPVSGVGKTSKIVISGGTLARPLELTDNTTTTQFDVWAGPGTRSCMAGNCVDGTSGFIIDWLAGPVPDKPSDLPHFEVFFYAADDRVPSGPEQLVYAVAYEYDAASAVGYVYLPGKTDAWFAVNTRAILRGAEGRWFRASRAWQEAVVPRIARP